MKYLKDVGIVAIDHHKPKKPRLPTSGGIIVSFGYLLGLLFFIAIQTFIFNVKGGIIYLLAACSTILIITFVGLLDDLRVKKELKESKIGEMDIRVGLKQWLKPLMTFPAAIPLMVVKAGVATMNIPFIGDVDFGILYPLVLVPIGVVGASNMVNLLGGFNGCEAGMGLIYTLSLGLYAIQSGSVEAAAIFFILSASLLAFLFYNFYPAKILPGDSLTYLLGAIFATGVIIGNMERIGVIVAIPFIFEFLLKLRSKFKATCLGKLRKDGTIEPPYGKKIYSLTHILLNVKRMKEWEVTLWLMLIQLFFSVLPAFLF